MAMQARGRRDGSIAEINVTPMADVMIVLLIIFMVATSVIIRAEVRLPDAFNVWEKEGAPLVIVVKADRTVKIGATELAYPAPVEAAARAWLDAAGPGRGEVLVQADESASYARVAEVLEACRRAGAEKIGLQTERGLRSAL
jgi:biopolymer transport protein TolR